jgi:hypothetical protein
MQETDFLDAPSSRSELLWPVAWAASVVVVSIFAVRAFSEDFVERTLLLHAESSALTWRAEFTSSVPDLSALLSGSRATEAQRDYLQATMAGSDIFRFELFDAGGNLAFLSDQALFEVEAADRFNPTAAETARTGAIDVVVEDGRAKPNRPDWYVEAYMPIETAEGRVSGVVEVYVDVTGLAATLRERFDWLSLLLIGAAAVVYLVPTLLLDPAQPAVAAARPGTASPVDAGPAHRPSQSRGLQRGPPRPCFACAVRTARTSACSLSTWTSSRRSMTRWAMTLGINSSTHVAGKLEGRVPKQRHRGAAWRR